MWRLYQGFRTVICIGEKCLRYDPFRGSIDILRSDAYFSYSLPDLMGRDLRIAITPNGEMFDRIISLKNWSPLAHMVMELIAEEMGGKFCETGFPDDVREDNSMALKRDIDVMVFESSLTSTDFNRLEVITLIDHGEISFIVPDLGFMPSYLTPAKCFSVTVWFFILGVLVLFVVVHEIYLRLSTKMYPEATAGISTALTIFSYSICVGHSRLLLGSVTGRILFMVTTFAFMILTTVFLSLMTTFFSEQVRYTPLDTVDDLRESDVMFQLMGADDEKFSFTDDPKYEWLKKRVKNSLESYVTELAEPTNTVVSYMVESDELIIMGEPLNASKLTVREMYKGIAAIIENDGFVAFLPRNAKKRDLLSVSSAPYSKQKFIDFHVVEEPIMSYPYDMRIPRGSVYGDVIRSYAARLAEAGILEELYELQVLGPVFHERFRRFEDDKSELPKVFNMADLRLAFFILVFGHLVSSLVFVSELLYSK
ncbi:unnamed protein product [Bemisia tabaci]|uniref:Ionotropic glutamate receptor C-terminal domain-containing protein n=1 Tax=Bemisia tabaci TaxID=7038 RepID=A0A9P0EX28_BEMTA|nr:unnamed protein product [Bemisia tabaci]